MLTVKDLIEKLLDMPLHLPVYAEDKPADKVIVEYYNNDPQIVRIFKAWDVTFVDSPIANMEKNNNG